MFGWQLKHGIETIGMSSGLVAYYAFESLLVDSTGRGNTLTNSGASQGTGKVGNGANFSGFDQSLSAASNADTSPPGSFTLACWIKPTANCSGAIIDKEADAVGDGEGYALTFSTFSPSLFRVSLAVQPALNLDTGFVSTGTLSVNAWHFIVASWDNSTKTLRIIADNGAPATQTDNASGYTPSSIPLVLGTTGLDIGVGPFDSDEICLWNRALSAAEAGALYNGGNGTTWPL